MMLLSIWPRLMDVYLILGTRMFVSQASRWLFVRKFNFYRLDLESFSPSKKPLHLIKYYEYTDSHLYDLLEMNPALTQKCIQKKLKSGKTCLLGFLGNDAVVYHWHSDYITRLDYLGLDFICESGEVCVVETYVPIRFRNQGIYQAATIYNCIHLINQGYRSVVTFAASWHYPTHHLLVDILGFHEKGSIVFRPVAPFGKHSLCGVLRLNSEGGLKAAGWASK